MLHTFTKRRLSTVSGVLTASLLILSLASIPAAAATELPSDSQIDAARSSTAATAALVSDIEGALRAAAAELQAAQVEAMKSQGAYVDALAERDERRAAAARLMAEAEQAASSYDTASTELGELAGDIYRAGGILPDASLLAFAADPGSVMYHASTVEGLAASRTRTVHEAQTSARAFEALRADAAEAEASAAAAAVTAEEAGKATQSAMAAAARLVDEKEAERGALVGHLAVLRDTTAALEEERIAGLEQERREAELARILAASSEAAVEAGVPSRAPSLLAPPPVAATGGVARDTALPSAVSQSGSPAPEPRQTTPAPAPQRTPEPTPPPAAPRPMPPTVPQPAPPPAPTPPTASSGGVAAAVDYARARMGAPYHYAWGGNGPRGYDCSGLVQQAFAAAGISLPRTASAQFQAARTYVPLAQAQYGDLVFWGEGGGIWHVAIYVGNNTVVNALNPQQGIVEVSLANMSGMGALNPLAARF